MTWKIGFGVPIWNLERNRNSSYITIDLILFQFHLNYMYALLIFVSGQMLKSIADADLFIGAVELGCMAATKRSPEEYEADLSLPFNWVVLRAALPGGVKRAVSSRLLLKIFPMEAVQLR